ncbi:MAG: hypothetical protein DHS20C18_24940 [Saprospiraceae bacterium]|nr:MAG: hypothetical protein DHS20C18_24940 [Saprospiraceae bacterium]
MRILIITSQYYPSVSPNVYRWGAIAEYWVKQGHEVHIVCTYRSGLEKKTVQKGVFIHRAGANSLLDWVYNLIGKKKRRGEVGSQRSNGFFRKVMEGVIDISWRSFYWPDGRCLWYLPGRQLARNLIRQFDFDAVVSVGLPFTAHLIALACKRSISSLHWLVDIEDPFSIAAESRINNQFLYNRLNHFAEQKVLRLADAVSVTVEPAKEKYLDHFPEIREKIWVIPPLFSLEIPPSGEGSLWMPEKDKTHLAYFGAFYHRIRTPDSLLKLLTVTLDSHPHFKKKLLIHFFGEIDPAFYTIFNAYPTLKDNLRMHGLVSRQEVALVTREIDFLLNIGNRTAYHLPSKSVDYLMSGKPIINICYHEADTFARFMSEYPLILNLPIGRDIRANHIEAFTRFLETKKGQTVPLELRMQMAQPYTLRVVADQYLKLLGG